LVGVILGDLHIQKFTENGNPNCQFSQGLVHKDYLYHLYSFFKDFCSSEPSIKNQKLVSTTGKVNSRIRFSTNCLPCFNEFYNLFYSNGKKVIPKNIGDLLTPAGLAFFAQDDGYMNKSNFYFCTDNFTLNEVTLLVSVLKNKFNLDCTIVSRSKDKNQYRICIRAKSLPLFKELVSPYFHDSMKYKLNKSTSKESE
jgi:hypothetical protein